MYEWSFVFNKNMAQVAFILYYVVSLYSCVRLERGLPHLVNVGNAVTPTYATINAHVSAKKI
jgi:hypothetical protein